MTIASAGMPILAGQLRQAAYESVKLAVIALLLAVPGRPVRNLRSIGGREAVEHRIVGTSLDFVLRWCCLSNVDPFAGSEKPPFAAVAFLWCRIQNEKGLAESTARPKKSDGNLLT